MKGSPVLGEGYGGCCWAQSLLRLPWGRGIIPPPAGETGGRDHRGGAATVATAMCVRQADTIQPHPTQQPQGAYVVCPLYRGENHTLGTELRRQGFLGTNWCPRTHFTDPKAPEIAAGSPSVWF